MWSEALFHAEFQLALTTPVRVEWRSLVSWGLKSKVGVLFAAVSWIVGSLKEGKLDL